MREKIFGLGGEDNGRHCYFVKGENISISDIAEDGNIECIRYDELYTEYIEASKEVKAITNLYQTAFKS